MVIKYLCRSNNVQIIFSQFKLQIKYFVANCGTNNSDDLSLESMMTDKMHDAWINCQRLSPVYMCVCVCVTELHSSYADARRTLESWRRNRRRETEGAKREKAEVNHATPVTTSVRWQTSTVDVTAQEVEATSDNDLNRIKVRPPPALPRDPPSVVIASLMSWENHPQLQINRSWPKLLSSAGRDICVFNILDLFVNNSQNYLSYF